MTIRHFRTFDDLSTTDLLRILDRASELKRLRGTDAHPRPLAGKTVALVLEKASTRTRASFEVGIHELGAYPMTLVSRDTQMGRGEPIEDTARMLSRYAHAVAFRTFGHDRIEAMAAAASVPVINALSDDHHPCQLLADLMTIRESTSGRLDGVKVAWIGDGNNMAHSWIQVAAMVGLDLRVCCPVGYDPKREIVERARSLGGGAVTLHREPAEAAEGADVVTTDVWASMGQEEEAAARREAFSRFIVDETLMARTHGDAIFLHCLPAHRGEEVSAEVIDGPRSRVWDEAENRLHSQKALLEFVMGA
jgi:ornithine carbamoyltransferase